MSPSRVHQILTSLDVDEIPVWLSQLREQGWPSEQKAGTEQSVESTLSDLLAAEVEALRRCRAPSGCGWSRPSVGRELVRRRLSLKPARRRLAPAIVVGWPSHHHSQGG